MAKKDIEREEDSLEVDTGEARVYELGFHLDPELPTEEVKKAYQTIKGLVEEKGGLLVAEGEPMKIKLAYTISRQETSGRRDFDSAYFSWIAYEMTPQNHTEVISAVHADKRVVRFIDVVTTKDAARHAAEMHDISLKASSERPTEDQEEVAGASLDAALENVAV
jgi:ribosomal protein S6